MWFGYLGKLLCLLAFRGPAVAPCSLVDVMCEWRLAYCGVDAPDSPLCVSSGCHIGRGGGVGGFVVGLFSGFLCVAVVVLVTMCECWLAL